MWEGCRLKLLIVACITRCLCGHKLVCLRTQELGLATFKQHVLLHEGIIVLGELAIARTQLHRTKSLPCGIAAADAFDHIEEEDVGEGLVRLNPKAHHTHDAAPR